MAEKKQVKESKDKKEKSKKDAEKPSAEKDVKIPSRLFDYYRGEIIPGLMKTFSYRNVMQVPKIEKIVVNMGVGAAVAEPKILEEAVRELESITGQKASIRKAKKAISNFKLREGLSIGAMVTLRKEKMYEFLRQAYKRCSSSCERLSRLIR